MSPAVKCLSVDTLISVMNKVEFKYLFKFSKNSGRIAEWSALQTGKRGDPGSIPAKVKVFFFFTGIKNFVNYNVCLFELNSIV